jgi:hypothetical protein
VRGEKDWDEEALQKKAFGASSLDPHSFITQETGEGSEADYAARSARRRKYI